MENFNIYMRSFIKNYCFLTVFLVGITVNYFTKETTILF
jgi:hypothetical protein